MLTEGLTELIRADPFPLDRPCSETLMARIVASSMAVFAQPATSVAAVGQTTTANAQSKSGVSEARKGGYLIDS